MGVPPMFQPWHGRPAHVLSPPLRFSDLCALCVLSRPILLLRFFSRSPTARPSSPSPQRLRFSDPFSDLCALCVPSRPILLLLLTALTSAATLALSPAAHAAATLDASATGPSTAAASSATYKLTVATTGEPFLATSATPPAPSAPALVLTPGFVAQVHHPATFILTSGTGGASLTLPIGSHGALATATAVVLRLHDASGPLTIQAPAGFEISLTAGSGFAASLTFVPVSADLVLHLRVAAATSAGTHSGDLAVSLAGHPIDGAPLPVSARITSLSAVSDTVLRPPGVPLRISIPGLLANDISSDDGSLALHAFSANTAQNVPLTRSGAFLLYPAPSGLSASDSFSYTVTDTFGATSTATVAIQVEAPEPVPTQTTLSIAARDGGGVILKLLGVPGRLYTIEVSTDLESWNPLTTATADAQGRYTVEDPVAPSPARFYRAVYLP